MLSAGVEVVLGVRSFSDLSVLGLHLCPDKVGIYREIARMLRPGGRMMVADICIEKPVPQEALHDIDLWTG